MEPLGKCQVLLQFSLMRDAFCEDNVKSWIVPLRGVTKCARYSPTEEILEMFLVQLARRLGSIQSRNLADVNSYNFYYHAVTVFSLKDTHVF